MAKMMLKKDAWKGQKCFIIGGGESLRGFDFSQLSGNIIVINRAFIDCPQASIFFTEDVRVVERYANLLQLFRGVKVVHCLDRSYRIQLQAALPSITIIDCNKETCWAKDFGQGLSYNSNSGIGAINLADILGADPIYLLGFDCRSFKDKGNYHDDYQKDWQTGRHQYEDFKRDFKHWVAPHVKHRRIINVINPDKPSALDHWVTATFQQVFK
jgi:hypothetical protein